jgi:signal transduction histidine kinase
MSVAGLACSVVAAACFVAGLLALRALRRRLELVAAAEHELRGPVTAMALACRRMHGDPQAAGYADVLEAQLERMRAGLDDLVAARRGATGARRSAAPVDLNPFVRAALEPWRTKLERCSVDWRAGATVAVTDRGRLAQALGNLLANSAEHGNGDLRVRAVRVPGALRLELRNGNRARACDGPGADPWPGSAGGERVDRGRGLSIARRAARELGGRLLVHLDEAGTMAVLELPDGAVVEPAPGEAKGARERDPGPGDDRTDSDLVA